MFGTPAWVGAAVYDAQWQVVRQGLFDADTSFSHADKHRSFVKNQSQ